MRKILFLVCLGAASVPGVARAVNEASPVPSWVEHIKIHGDLRYRHEWIRSEGKKDRTRHRIRARVGVKARVNETVDVGLQIASGSDDPVSTNQTLDGGFSSKSIMLDLAAFKWHPVQSLTVVGGKVKNPFHTPGKTELIWDGDLRPEGGAVKISGSGASWKLFTNLGGFWVEERSDAANTGFLGVQAGAEHSFLFFGDEGSVLLGGTYYNYGNVVSRPPVHDAADAFGNTVDIKGNYAHDFDLLESFGEFRLTVRGTPVSIFGDVVTNTASGVEADRGWLAGGTLGECKAPHSWAFRYNYRDLEADAVLGVFTDSDFRGGGTDGAGHEVGLDYQIDKGWKAGASYFDNDRGVSSETKNYRRLQLDLALKF